MVPVKITALVQMHRARVFSPESSTILSNLLVAENVMWKKVSAAPFFIEGEFPEPLWHFDMK